MDFLSALRASASGLSAQRERLNIATSNLANAETTRGPDGQPYRRRDPVFATVLDAQTGEVAGVKVAEVREDTTPGQRVFHPGHPDADGEGYVTLPNVNPLHEVTNLLSASRGFEANATAAETLKTLAQRALDIGR